jgi:hypothetical protein
MKQILAFTVVTFFVVQYTNAQQKIIAEEEQLWTGYFNQTRFNNKWGIWADVHIRTKENFFNNLSQIVVRPGITYYLSNDLKLTAGYAYINHFPADNHKNISQPEHGSSYNFIRSIHVLNLCSGCV